MTDTERTGLALAAFAVVLAVGPVAWAAPLYGPLSTLDADARSAGVADGTGTGSGSSDSGTAGVGSVGAVPDDESADCSLPTADPAAVTGDRTAGTGADSPPPREAGIEIDTVHDGPVSVVLVRNPDGRAVTTFVERYPADRTSIDLDGVTASGADYRVVVRADCEVVWERTVGAGESYELRIGEDGTVEVLGHAVA